MRRLRFGAFVLDLRRAELTRNGAVVPLRPKPFALLATFVRQPGTVLSKEELLAAVWPGVVVGDDSLTQAVHDLRTALGEDGSALIRTIARRGYRFDAAAVDAETPAPAVPPVRSERWLAGFGAFVTVTLMAAIAVYTMLRPPPAPPLSLVVLPLAQDDAVGPWFGEVLTNDLTVALGQISGAFVISRETAAGYARTRSDPRRVARELGVRHVVHGAVRRDGDRVRLSLEMVEGRAGVQLWAQSYDIDRAGLAGAVDAVALEVARSLNVQMIRAAAAAVPLDVGRIQADDLAMQGFGIYFRGVSRDNLLAARRLFDAAVAGDPRSIRGWGGVAVANGILAGNRWAPDYDAAVARVTEAAERLQALDEHDAHTYFARLFQAGLGRDHETLLRVATRMNERLPSYPHGHLFRSMALLNLGRFDECIDAVRRAIQLGPRDPTIGLRYRHLGTCQFMRGDYAGAVQSAREAVQHNPRLPLPPLLLAAALERNGQSDEARALVAEHLRTHPAARAADVATLAHGGHEPRYREGEQRWIESLKLLGMP